MSRHPLEAIWYILGVCIIIFAIFVFAGLLKEPTAEQKWVMARDKLCESSKSRGSYIKETKTYECWSKPAFRHPKLVFSERYE